MTEAYQSGIVLDKILENLSQVVPFTSACIFLLRGDHMRAVAALGQPDLKKVKATQYPIEDALCQRISLTRKPVILKDARSAPDFHSWGATKYVRGWMGVPLIIRNEVIGYLTLDSSEINAYGEQESRLTQAFANQAAITIENVQLNTETQRLLQKTSKQAHELQQIMDFFPDGIILFGKDQRIAILNRSARAYLSHFSDVAVGDRLERIGSLQIRSLLNTKGSPPSWREITSYDEKDIFEVAARTFEDSGTGEDFLVIMRNVTEQRKEEDYLKSQERLATVGQLAAGIAHDFNNIMAVITLYTQLNMRNPNLPEKDARRLATVQQEAQRASDLIRQILDFSRQSVLARKPMDLLPFLRDFVSSLKYSFPDKIGIELSCEEGEYLVIADPNRIEQALTNLAYNSREAMTDGGRIAFVLSALNLGPNSAFPLPDMGPGSWFVIKVKDSGAGFPREDLRHLFEPFFETRPLGKRAGLGLAQVYGIIKQHDGFIDVDSQVGMGTEFTIYLPAYETPKQPAVLPEFSALPQGNGERILIVEDEASTREALSDICRLLNYDTISASNGEEALVRYDEVAGDVDLVISDMIMPRMNGAELFKELEKRDPTVKMILLTGYPLDSSGREIISQGVAKYIEKPVQIQEVAAAIKNAIEKAS